MRTVVVLNNHDRYLTLWEAVTDLGEDLHVVAPRAMADRLPERPGLTVHAVDDRFLRRGRETWRVVPGLRRIVRSVDPDLLHLTTEPWSIATIQALATGRPTVVHGAETLFRSGTRAEILIRSVLCRWNLPRLAGYVGWNSMAIAMARREGLPTTTPTAVAPAEVPDPAAFATARSQRGEFRAAAGWSDSDLVVGFVGRYVPEKGLGWLVDAFGLVSDPTLRLACFGDGPERTVLEEASAGSDGRIRDHGPVPFASIPTLMASLDLLVVPSETTDEWVEQFGRVAVEAMLADTPVVSSDSGALPEVLADAAWIVPEGDRKALARALDGLAADPWRRRELATRGRHRASSAFAPALLAGRLASFWRRIAGAAPTEPHAPPPATSAPSMTPARTTPVIAVLMASHDRVTTTLRCLGSLRAQTITDVRIEVFLVDDGSTDGTTAAVAERFPEVHVVEGSGDLYWSGAMRIAQTEARRIAPDFLLWLNDDVDLDADAIERLLAAHRQLVDRDEAASIVVGGVADPTTSRTSYAGVVRPDRRRPTRFELLEPTDALQRCDSMNGNLVLVPELVFRRVEGFDGSYRHAMSDFDFGLRATAQGCAVWLAPGTFGTCAKDHSDSPWSNPDLGLVRASRILVSTKGLPPRDWLRFTRRHAGPAWPLYFASPYVRFAGSVLRGRTRGRDDGAIAERPLRVLHVFHELRRSGGETMMFTAHDLWTELGLECELVAVGDSVGDYAPALAARGYRIHHLRPSPAALLAGFLRLLVTRRPDVVHIHTERAGFWLALESRMSGARVVQTVHSLFEFTGSLRVERRIQRRIARWLGVTFVAVSESVAETERENFANTTEVIRNWVDLDEFAPATPEQRADVRRSLGLSDTDFVVLTVGNCWSLKNHALVIEAMALDSTPPDVVYLHVGDDSVDVGADERRLASRSANAGAIRFLGTRSDVPALLHASDLFVMPSAYEGASVAVIEALATDTPVLLGDSPGLREYRSLSDRIRLTALDPDAISAAIGEFRSLRSSGTPARGGRAIATRWFDPHRGTAHYAEVYRRRTARRTPDGPR